MAFKFQLLCIAILALTYFITDLECQSATTPQTDDQMFTFIGEYKLTNSTNYYRILKELGHGHMRRLATDNSGPEVRISKIRGQANSFNIMTFTAYHTINNVDFTDGVEFNQYTTNGSVIPTTIRISGHSWEQKHTIKPELTIYRDFFLNGLSISLTVNGVEAVRNYKRM